jgi:hypothetical protein
METIYVGNTLINDVFVGSVRMDDIVSFPITLQQESYMFLSSSATINTYVIASAVNTLVLDLKAYGIWDKMYAIYPMVGGNSESCKWNLKDTTKYNLNYTGSWTFNDNGMTNSNTQWAGTSFTGDLFGSWSGSNSIGVYSRTSASDTGVDIGDSSLSHYVSCRYGDGNNKFVLGSDNQSAAVATGAGFFMGNYDRVQFPAFTKFTYRNGTQIGTGTAYNLSAASSNQYYIGGGSSDPSSRNYAYAFLGQALSTTEITNYNTAVQAFQTTLGRNV